MVMGENYHVVLVVVAGVEDNKCKELMKKRYRAILCL